MMTFPEKVKFADTVAAYHNTRYELGARGPHAYDCLTFVWHFYHDFKGITLPEACGDWTAENYVERYRADKQAALDVQLEWLRSFGEPVAWADMRVADLIILRHPEAVSAAIYIGRGHLLFLDPRHGMMTVGREVVDIDRAEVRRWAEE